DAVLNVGIDARDYAAHLLEIARTSKYSGRAWSSVLAMAQLPNLERRFVAMLNPSLNHRSATRIAVFAICVVAASVTLPLAAMRAPERTSKAVAAPTVLISESAPATPKRAPVRKLASAAAVAPAQGRADGSLTGTVYDGSGAVIPGATMIVSSRKVEGDRVIETEVETTTTGEAGNFKFDALPEG